MKLNIVIDGISLSVDQGTSIMDAANSLDIKIPALCYDKDLKVEGSCSLCLVEIKGREKLERACSTIVEEAMEISTNSNKVVKMRKNVLQLLLHSHPNDCLACEKSGECLLQEYAYEYGLRFKPYKGALREDLVDNSSPFILKDNSKCISCGKCIASCNLPYGRKVMTFANKGYDIHVALDAGLNFEDSNCISCNRCVSVCPVGALVDRRQIGKGRSWEFESKIVHCRACSFGCDFEVLSKDGENVAVRAKKAVEGRPLCLKGRMTTELMQLDEPEQPYMKMKGKFRKTNWKMVMNLNGLLRKIDKLDKKNKK